MTSLERKSKSKKSTVSKEVDAQQLKIDQETAMRKFRRRQRSISVKTVDSQPKTDLKIPGTNFPSKSNGPWNKHGTIKRPMNAFMLFGRGYRPVMVQMFPGAPNSQISIYLGNIWHSMTWEQQKPFFEEAKRIRYRHQNDYPEWLSERDNQRSIKYIKKLREDYMVPRKQMFLPEEDQTHIQLSPSISMCAQTDQGVSSSTDDAQEATDLIPEVDPASENILPVHVGNGETFNEGDFQILHTTPWVQDVMSQNNVDFTGYAHGAFPPLRDHPSYEEENDEDEEANNMEGTIQFGASGDQTSIDLQELWNLVESHSQPMQHPHSQDCRAEESLSLVELGNNQSQNQPMTTTASTNMGGPLTPQFGDQTSSSIDLEELWNLVEISPPPPPTQIAANSQDCDSYTWSDVSCENVLSAVAASADAFASSMIPTNSVEYTVGPTSWPTLDNTQCHLVQNDHLMEPFPEHSVQLVVADNPETLNVTAGDVLQKMNGNLVYIDNGPYNRSWNRFCQEENTQKWWSPPPAHD